MVIRPLNNEEHAIKLEYLFVNKDEREYELMHAAAYEKRGLDKNSEGPLMQKTFR